MHNGKFWNGLEAQLPSYLTSDSATHGWFLALQYRGTKSSVDRIRRLPSVVAVAASRTGMTLRSSVVDVRKPLSASNIEASDELPLMRSRRQSRDQAGEGLLRGAAREEGRHCSQRRAGAPSWELTALTPEFIETEHAQYAEAIAENLKKDDVLNIALSGNYGVGKSSILRRVAADHDGRVVELSLSTLSPIDDTEVDDSVPAQARTPTNRIQQEIVKQLLYREEPKSARASRFRRIERFSWGGRSCSPSWAAWSLRWPS